MNKIIFYLLLLLSFVFLYFFVRIVVISSTILNRYFSTRIFQFPFNFTKNNLFVSIFKLSMMVFFYLLIIKALYFDNSFSFKFLDSNLHIDNVHVDDVYIDYLMIVCLIILEIIYIKDILKEFPSSNLVFLSSLFKPYNELIFEDHIPNPNILISKNTNELESMNNDIGLKDIIILDQPNLENLSIDSFISEDDRSNFINFIKDKEKDSEKICLLRTSKSFKMDTLHFLSNFICLDKESLERKQKELNVKFKIEGLMLIDFLNQHFVFEPNICFNEADLCRYRKKLALKSVNR